MPDQKSTSPARHGYVGHRLRFSTRATGSQAAADLACVAAGLHVARQHVRNGLEIVTLPRVSAIINVINTRVNANDVSRIIKSLIAVISISMLVTLITLSTLATLITLISLITLNAKSRKNLNNPNRFTVRAYLAQRQVISY